MFGKDFRELAGLTEPGSWAAGRAAAHICEGCGIIQVDPDGNCVSRDCGKAGELGHGLPWAGEPGFPGEPAPEPPQQVRLPPTNTSVPTPEDLDALLANLK